MDFVIIILVELFCFFYFDWFLMLIERFKFELVFKMNVIMIFRCSCWGVFKIILKFVIFSGKEFFLFFFWHEEGFREFRILHFKLALLLWWECGNVIRECEILYFFFLFLNNFFFLADNFLFDNFLWLLLWNKVSNLLWSWLNELS